MRNSDSNSMQQIPCKKKSLGLPYVCKALVELTITVVVCYLYNRDTTSFKRNICTAFTRTAKCVWDLVNPPPSNGLSRTHCPLIQHFFVKQKLQREEGREVTSKFWLNPYAGARSVNS